MRCACVCVIPQDGVQHALPVSGAGSECTQPQPVRRGSCQHMMADVLFLLLALFSELSANASAEQNFTKRSYRPTASAQYGARHSNHYAALCQYSVLICLVEPPFQICELSVGRLLKQITPRCTCQRLARCPRPTKIRARTHRYKSAPPLQHTCAHKLLWRVSDCLRACSRVGWASGRLCKRKWVTVSTASKGA